jgi:cyclopropane fatty-acyl-phospholipid synthase-like methyltransferase/short-subunit dehydrogenase
MTKYSEKITREKFNFLKKYYDETWDKSEHTLHVGLFKNNHDSLSTAYRQATDHLIEETNKLLPIDKNSIILDIGCGTGRTLVELCLKYNCQGVGIDISDEQINDATSYTQKMNEKRAKQNLPAINTRFVRGSRSDLQKRFKKDEQFTHIISQDAILLVSDKQSLFNNIARLLKPGGVFSVADFLSESDKSQVTKKENKLIYKLVNWDKPLSFESYENILTDVGLNIVKSEKRNTDMVLTYNKLANRLEKYTKSKDKTYSELRDRYKSIAQSAKNNKMGWALFFTQKPEKKTALIAGSKQKSIGRFLANKLHREGWEIWLYGRSANKIDRPNWHERKCDISDENSVSKLFGEIKDLDLALMLADSGPAHGEIKELTQQGMKDSVNAKFIGSVLLTKEFERKFSKRKKPIKLVWCAGKPSKKSKNLIFYGIVNSGLDSYIESLNEHYNKIFQAYYLPTPLISPSTLGDKFIEEAGSDLKKLAKSPEVIEKKLKLILDDKVKPGMLKFDEDTL